MTIKTVKASGGDYTTLQAAINACPANITAAGTNETWEIELYASAGQQDPVTISGKTTDATHYIRIYAPTSERHNGVPGAGTKARIVSDFFSDAVAITSACNVKIHFIEFVCGTNPQGAVRFNAAAAMDVEIKGCLVGSGAWVYPAFSVYSATSGKMVVANSIGAFGSQGDFFNAASGTGYTCYLYNNTAYSTLTSSFGGIIGRSAGTVVCKNNVVRVGSGTYSCYSGTMSGNNNISSDGTAPGTTATINSTPTFVNAAGNNFHIASGDTVARGHGADLSADANFAFSDDIDGDTRSGTWDAGADQFFVAPVGGGSLIVTCLGI